jgi:hypothetical protein
VISWLDSGDLAGLSAMLAYWFGLATLGHGTLIWRYRARFLRWFSLSARDRADALLSIALFGILLNAAFQRAIATWALAVAEWRLSPLTTVAAPIYLVWSLIFTAGLLWWLALELLGPNRYLWWLLAMLSGVALCLGVAWWF